MIMRFTLNYFVLNSPTDFVQHIVIQMANKLNGHDKSIADIQLNAMIIFCTPDKLK